MRKSNPHMLSLNLNPLFCDYPYNCWTKYCQTESELIGLFTIFQTVPTLWISSIEKNIENSRKRNLHITHPLNYRVSLLRNSIFLIQEAKFICDTLENSLRQIFLQNIISNKLTYEDLKFIPNYNITVADYSNKIGISINNNEIISPNFVYRFSFYQLTEGISRKWKRIDNAKNGFGTFFRNDPKCRDFNIFRKDMKYLRIVRNGISHSNEYFTNVQIQKAYNVSLKWLNPLSIDLNQKIIDYRKKRPNFLDNIEITIANILYK